MPKLLRSKLILQFVFLLLIGSGIVAGVRLVQVRQELREEAVTVPTKLNKGINFLLETNNPHESVPFKIGTKDVNYLKELNVDEVVVATAWSRVACKDPHIITQEHSPLNISVSSEYNTSTGEEGFSRQNLTDGRPWSRWASRYYGNTDPGDVVEWVSYVFPSPVTVNQIVVIPAVWNAHREFGVNAFPRSFNFSYSDDGLNWHVLKTFNDYPNPSVNSYDNTPPTITFNIPEQTHKYFGFGVTRLRPDYYGGYFAQLGELKFRKVISNIADPEDSNNANYNWSYLDESINVLRNGGITNIALVIGGTPRWAIMNHEDSCWESPYFSEFLSYNPYPPNKYDKLSEFSHFAAAVAKRYGGKIQRLSFYNEPNLSMFWKGTVSEYVSIHNAAYDKVKQIAPSLEVGGGLTAPHGSSSPLHPLNWLSTVKNQNYKFDVYEHHFYPENDTNAPWGQGTLTDGRVGVGNPEDLLNKLKSLYSGKTVPVVNNEAGYQINKVGLANKAKYLKWILENYKNYSNDPKTPFTTWSNFMLYVHPNWQTGLIDVGCKMGYPQALNSTEQQNVINGQIDKVIKNNQGDCLTPAFYAFKNANTILTTPTPVVATNTPTSTPRPNPAPIGSHDTSTGCDLRGWTCDESNFSIPLRVDVYEGAGWAKFVGSTLANNRAEQGVADWCGGDYDHRFTYNLPDSYKDGNPHTFYTYAIGINWDGSLDGLNPALWGTPRIVTCPTPTATPTNTPTPTKRPTNTPIPTSTLTPTRRPTNTPTPTSKPTNTPTHKPTNTPTLRPTNTPTPKPTVSQCGSVPGDVNNDGKINVLDIIKIISVYNTQPPGDPCADLNSDGKVNVLDIIKVISYY